MVIKLRHEKTGSRWVVTSPETAWYAEEPVLPR